MKKTASALLFLLLALAGPAPSRAQGNPSLYYQAGNGFYAQKKYDQALRYYDAALKLNPRLWQVYEAEGNCYYAEGRKEKSVACYQRCLDLHPDNPQLRSFVRILRDSMKKEASAPENRQERADVKKYLRKAEGLSDAHWELAPSLGLTPVDTPMGLGLGGGLFYMFDSNYGVGAMAHLYFFGTASSSGSASGTENAAILECLPSVKYKFDGSWLRPYVLGGLGLALVSVSSTTSTNPGNAFASSTQSGSAIFLDWDLGAGLEAALQPGLKVFLQARLDEILAGISTSYLPVEAGLNFKL